MKGSGQSDPPVFLRHESGALVRLAADSSNAPLPEYEMPLTGLCVLMVRFQLERLYAATQVSCRTNHENPAGSVPESSSSSRGRARGWWGDVSSSAYRRRLTSGNFTDA